MRNSKKPDDNAIFVIARPPIEVEGKLDRAIQGTLRPLDSRLRGNDSTRDLTYVSLSAGLNYGSTHFWTLFFMICILAFYPSSAFAHIEGGQATGFVTGLKHPWSGLDHVLAMIAVGLWGAQLGNPAMWILPVTFPLVMSMGAMMGLLGIPLPGIEIGIALSAILLGAMVLGEARPKLIIAALLVGFLAVFHGHAHGAELPPGQSALLYSMGFVIATGSLHGIGIALGLVHRWPAGRLALRSAGAFIAVMGVIFLWRALL